MVTLQTSHTYLQMIQDLYQNSTLWDYLHYDESGELWLTDVKISELVSTYGSPLEIHDMRIMKRRSDYWKNLVESVRTRVGYSGSFTYFYASKANMSLPYVLNAYRNGWMAETSSAQDLVHLLSLYNQNLIDTSISIICNGFKFPFDSPAGSLPDMYSQYILKLHSLGFHISPIFDSGELEHYLRSIDHGVMDVGLRLKFGVVHDDEHLVRSVSRHGMAWDELIESADVISRHEHMRFTTLHIMVSAAQVTPLDEMVSSLLYGAEKYFELKRRFHDLRFLNVGGGVPPLSSGYDYEKFLSLFLDGVRLLAAKYSCDVPDIMFEFGSFLSEECGFYVHRVLQRKGNSLGKNEASLSWAIVDGGLMAELPDMFITHKDFTVLGVNGALSRPAEFILGDLSCDSDGRYPRKNAETHGVILPDTDHQLLLIPCVGSYQKMLSGAGGAHHCGILNSGQVIIEDILGETSIRFIPKQSETDYAFALGYGTALTRSADTKKSWWRMLLPSQ